MVMKVLSLFILIWASLGDWLLWEKGKASRMSFIFVWGSKTFILFGSSLTIWLGRRQLSLSFPLFVADRRSKYVFMLVWFLLGTLVYFLFFVHFCIHSRLSSDCDWLVG
jgi:hypothetical protein